MTYQVIGVALIAAIYFLVQYLNRTETPKIEGIPEVSGYPLFGSLIELGTNHAKVAQRWAEKYGPVFQVRMGNKI
ncbi:hypothetical protein LTS18_001755 [Coniosporium uncinatum]|uniref:Uncharacterized protein n=1 Tax=Coniosporium uncinatum TaxID=93489 RepID=A0ACC3CT01_9PEZI|nr:hypothetical protein LTS18_001755 [Coniosporium uncinatum]